jgi:hypothetical protein
MVALVQADGKYELEKPKSEGGNNGDAGDYWTAGMMLGSDCNVHPNTCTYQNGIIQSTSVVISDISVSIETVITDNSVSAALLTFRISGLGGAASTPSPSPPAGKGTTGSPAGSAVIATPFPTTTSGGAISSGTPTSSTGGALLTSAPVGSNSGSAVLTNAPAGNNSSGALLTTAPGGSAVIVGAPSTGSAQVSTMAPTIVSTSALQNPPTDSPGIPTTKPPALTPTNLTAPVQSNCTQTLSPLDGDNSTKTDLDNSQNKTGGKIVSKPSTATTRSTPSVRIVFDHCVLPLLLFWLI